MVLYDNLLDEAERPELRSVVAHELGHVAHDDIRRGIALRRDRRPARAAVRRASSALALARRSGRRPGDAGGAARLPARRSRSPPSSSASPGNQLSRKVEASADGFALQLTDDPAALIDLQPQLARTNLSDPDPPALVAVLFGTHPSTVERIGAALAYRRADVSEVARESLRAAAIAKLARAIAAVDRAGWQRAVGAARSACGRSGTSRSGRRS